MLSNENKTRMNGKGKKRKLKRNKKNLLAERIKTKTIAWQKIKTKMSNTENYIFEELEYQVNNQACNAAAAPFKFKTVTFQ